MCLEGLTRGSVSRVPKRRRTVSGLASCRFSIGEPHRPQKQRFTPGEDSHSLSNSAPVRKQKAADETEALLAKAAPEALRHWLQWQLVTGPSSASISY